MTEEMGPYECLVCGYIYDPKAGDPKARIPPGVEFNALPCEVSTKRERE